MYAVFGTDMPLAVRVVVAIVVVIALICAIGYLVHRFGAGALNAASAVRGRQPRLAVIDAAAVDGRRRLLLIRRDNVEHLIMIGGPSDVVIEPNIVRAAAAAPVREAPPARAADMLPRAVPLAEGSMWPLPSEPMPRASRLTPPPAPQPDETGAAWSMHPEAAPRTVPDSEPRAGREPRPALDRELRIATEREARVVRSTPEREPRVTAEREPRAITDSDLNVASEREARSSPATASRPALDGTTRGPNSERLAGLAADLSRTYLEPAPTSPPPPPPPGRNAETRRTPPSPVQPLTESDEQNLAEMALQLESALQRQRPATAPAIVPPTPRAEAKSETKSEIKSDAKPETKPDTKSDTKPAAKTPVKSFDNLEQEMASLLGRPSGKG
ncbi:MAG TPA: flagellar biosynthesis protein FliO [Xanthobacteraceae bacterium]